MISDVGNVLGLVATELRERLVADTGTWLFSQLVFAGVAALSEPEPIPEAKPRCAKGHGCQCYTAERGRVTHRASPWVKALATRLLAPSGFPSMTAPKLMLGMKKCIDLNPSSEPSC